MWCPDHIAAVAAASDDDDDDDDDGQDDAFPVFWTDALGKVALNGETLKLLSVCGSEVN